MSRRTMAYSLAAAHLTLVAAGASGLLGRSGDGPGGRAARWYGAVTGADAGYSYFAPVVGCEVRVRFTLSDGRGRVWADDLTAGLNQEGRLRVGSMTGLFPADPAQQPLRHDLAASWAATAFGRHPEARTVVVRVEVYEVPPMADYRAGHRPGWVQVFAATFETLGAEDKSIPSSDKPELFTRRLNAGDPNGRR